MSTRLNRFARFAAPAVVSVVTGCTSWVTDPVLDHVAEPTIERADREAGAWSGDREGTWTSGDGVVHPARWVVDQDGLALTGHLELREHPCTDPLELVGSVKGSGAELTVRSDAAEISFRLSTWDQAFETDYDLWAFGTAACLERNGDRARVTATSFER